MHSSRTGVRSGGGCSVRGGTAEAVPFPSVGDARVFTGGKCRAALRSTPSQRARRSGAPGWGHPSLREL